jgi:hypothetical protein
LPLEGSRFNGSRFGGLVVRGFGISVFRKLNIEYRTSNIEHCLWRVRGLMVRGLEVRFFGFSVFRLFGNRTSNIEYCLWRVRGLMVRGLEVRFFGFSVVRFFGFSEIEYRISNIAFGGFEV